MHRNDVLYSIGKMYCSGQAWFAVPKETETGFWRTIHEASLASRVRPLLVVAEDACCRRVVVEMAASSSRVRARDDAAPPVPALVLSGGHAEPPRTVDKYRRGTSCDAILCAANGTDFHVHRVVVMGKAEYFEAIYGGNWGDAHGAVTLSQIPADALAGCLEWIYVGQAPVASDEALFALLEAAVYLRIDDLMRVAAKAATLRLGPSTALGAWSVAEPHAELSALAAAAQRIASRSFSAIVVDGAAWASVPIARVCALLADDRLAISEEEEVYAAAIAWISVRGVESSEATRLLALIRYAHLQPDFVANVVRMEPLLQTAEGQALLLDAFQAAWSGSPPRARLGGRRGFLFVLGGHVREASGHDQGGSDVVRVCSSIERYDPDVACETDRWQPMPPMPTGRAAFGCAVLRDKIYVIGGRSKDLPLLAGRTMDCFNIVTQTWQAAPPMTTRRVGCAAVALDGKLYVVGGCFDDLIGVRTSMERFDPDTQAWEAMPPVPAARLYCSAATVHGKLYVIGGKVGLGFRWASDPSDSMERFDPASNTWEAMPSMATGRYNCASAVMDGKLYVFGGFGTHESVLDSVESFDPATNEWARMPLMALKRAGLRASALNGQIYVQGGQVSGRMVHHSILEVFSPARASDDPLSAWSTAPLSQGGPSRESGAIVAWHD